MAEGLFLILCIAWLLWFVGYPIYYFSSNPRDSFDWTFYSLVLCVLALVLNICGRLM